MTATARLMKGIKPSQSDIELFKKEFAALRSHIDEKESEEFHKNLIINFLNTVYYKDKYYINTKSRKDLVIHHDNNTSSSVGVLIETKSPTNKSEMVSCNNFNVKSFQELVLYYLQERKAEKNFELCSLIITNIYEWFIFDAQDFERLFYQNKTLLHHFEQFSEGKLSGTKTDFFYKEIAAPEIQKLQTKIPYTHFDIRDYDEKSLNLYKYLHPVHLLKLQPTNDNNKLDEEFYAELLHIIGLEEETKEGKKLISRKKTDNDGSLIETAMHHIKSDEREVLNDPQYGENKEERAYNAAFRLAIIWINRILFLKLLEAQICKYHNKDKNYVFLSTNTLENYGDLNELFFSVLAAKTDERQPEHLKTKFVKVPYLNSSLFEQTDIEKNSIYIRALGHITHFKTYSKSVLKDESPKSHLEYLLRFLDAYNFSSEDSESTQESKPLISASVLGLIFEKINGYKDGSFFTPSFITMYMCRETIGRAVVQKFNEAKGWNCQSIDDLHNHIGKNTEDVKEANRIFNTVRICDPAVGSGHFLVSALNEMIWLKYKLKILADKDGKRLKSYNIEVSNDELNITDGDGKNFVYNPKDSESQWVQKVLFNEKRIIIENCLFGVDVNPNSVEICRLRLWIELLKNAYYRNGGKGELETLPNIDINIKHGNSLISRFDLYEKYAKPGLYDSRKLQEITKEYKAQVFLYKNCSDDRDAKKVIFKRIEEIKRTFNEINDTNDLDFKKWHEAEHKFRTHVDSIRLGDDKNEWEKKLEDLQKEEECLKKVLQEKKKDAFEWSFEFPEVMDEDGNFVGFDIIIGNPPYLKEGRIAKEFFEKYKILPYYQGKMDLWYIFACIGINLLKEKGILSFIATNNWTTAAGASKLRNYIIEKSKIIQLVDFGSFMVFDLANIQTMIMSFLNDNKADNYSIDYRKLVGNVEITNKDITNFLNKKPNNKAVYFSPTIIRNKLKDKFLTFSSNETILDKIAEKGIFLRENELAQGIVFPQDFLNKGNQEILGSKFVVGEGIFALSEKEKNNLKLSKNELKLIKPYYTTEQIHRYYSDPKNKLWLIYTDSSFKNPNSMDNYPNLKKHLDRFFAVITSHNKPYGLHRTREERFFKGEKIIVQRKCAGQPSFSYSNFDCYVSATFYVIKTDRLNLKYLVGLLNSKLIAFWLKNKGKMQGDNYQLDKEPLLQIPIYYPSKESENIIISLVNYILFLKNNDNFASIYFENIIDTCIYEFYFSNEIHIVKKGIIEYLQDLKPIENTMTDEQKQVIVNNEFERLYEPHHPVRNNVETIENIELVRIIKESLRK